MISGTLNLYGVSDYKGYMYWYAPEPISGGWAHFASDGNKNYRNSIVYSDLMPLTIRTGDISAFIPSGNSDYYALIKIFTSTISEKDIIREYKKEKQFF